MADQVNGIGRKLPSRKLSKSTLENRQNGWGHWFDYCAENGLCNFPADPADVVTFIEAMSVKRKPGTNETYKPGTIDGCVSAISVVHKERKAVSPLLDIEVRRAKTDAYRNGPPTKQAKGMTSIIRDAMLATCTGEDLESLRDRALINIAYDTLSRRGEMTNLDIGDIERHETNLGGTAFIQKLKTDRKDTGRYAYVSPITLGCVDKWTGAAQISEGPVFRSTHHGRVGKVALGPKAVATALRKRARLANLPEHIVKGITGHSGRVGAAQDMAKRGDNRDAIMCAGGWKNENTVRRYTEKMDALFNGSARLAKAQGPAGENKAPKIRITALEKMDLLLQSQIIAALASLASVERFENPE